MTRWERLLLLFSLALNVAFVSVAAVNVGRDRSEPRRREDRPQLRRGGDPGFSMGRRDRRHARMARELGLDARQQREWDAQFARFAPELHEARARVAAARATYRRALARSDLDTARRATREVSQGQAIVDSLYAEVMLGEAAVLRPEQRDRYVRWTLRPEARGRRERGLDGPPGGGRR
jgi:hypothetical protein